jgi:cytochrome P450/NADPH-cytochrome P450 reductase
MIEEEQRQLRVCGDGARLVPGVKRALLDVYRTRSGNDDEERALAWLEELTASGRLVIDAWSSK